VLLSRPFEHWFWRIKLALVLELQMQALRRQRKMQSHTSDFSRWVLRRMLAGLVHIPPTAAKSRSWRDVPLRKAGILQLLS